MGVRERTAGQLAIHGLGPAERAATGGALLRRRLLPIAVALAGAALSTAAAAAQQTGVPDTSGATIRATAILTAVTLDGRPGEPFWRSEEHTSELQSHSDLVCRLLLEKKNKREGR